jgi:CubicO group peptidase (beta-lactamase class C family)
MNAGGDIAAPERLGFSSQRLRRLRDVLAADVEGGAIPGAVAVVARRGTTVFAEAVGFRDRETGAAMRVDSIFRGASATKPVAAVAALMLVEEGRLHLHEPVADYLPALAGLTVGVERAPLVRPPTVQDLFRHTAGFTYGPFGDTPVHRLYRDANVMDAGQTNAEMVEKLAQLPLAYQPGSTFEYGMSTDVLGAVVEAVSGTDLRAFVRERILQPLELADTDFLLDPSDRDRLAEPHLDPATKVNPLKFVFDPERETTWFSAGGGLLTTAFDYLKFAQALLNGGTHRGIRLLARKTVQLMTSDHLPPGVAFGPFTPSLGITAPIPEFGQGFGLGVVVRREAGRNPNPGSPGDFCWPGVSGVYWWADPVEELIGILMLAAPVQRVHYRSVMRNLVYQALD